MCIRDSILHATTYREVGHLFAFWINITSSLFNLLCSVCACTCVWGDSENNQLLWWLPNKYNCFTNWCILLLLKSGQHLLFVDLELFTWLLNKTNLMFDTRMFFIFIYHHLHDILNTHATFDIGNVSHLTTLLWQNKCHFISCTYIRHCNTSTIIHCPFIYTLLKLMYNCSIRFVQKTFSVSDCQTKHNRVKRKEDLHCN